ncbi:hypothetical protein F383_19567 [Gossypium arboreum]|uniref:Uncharacterized protein n=1 Tax=Gossypium arboreum TaxID=29729 RepID=A0A0B0NP26_GOSAR|nr:hypothetical protein F383_19567 [Gossypium arboreum]
MGELAKVLYIVVVDEGEKRDKETSSFRYTRPVLQSTLQLMGCKARHAFKFLWRVDPLAECILCISYQISRRVFELVRSEASYSSLLQQGSETLNSDGLRWNSEKEDAYSNFNDFQRAEAGSRLASNEDDRNKGIPFELYKRRTSVVVKREAFLDVVCDALAEYKYVGPNQRADLVLACRIREKKESVTVLLCGTSGCGKSTLSALLGSRLGITTVISTDSIRHMMRSFVNEKENPLLWASTYHAGECLDPVAVTEAKAKKRAKKLAGISQSLSKSELADRTSAGKSDARPVEGSSTGTELIGPRQMAVEGFKAQSEMVIDSLDRLITAWEERKESVVVEGVHLSLNFVCAANSLSSKGMFQLIHRSGSSRQLMALLNKDGSVAKAWSVESIDSNGRPISGHGTEGLSGMPLYGPLTIGKAEPVNLQFGHYGISAWPSDGGTSHAGSVDESRFDGTDNGSRYQSSCCSSPRMSDGPSKELMEENSVFGSDEEVDDPPEVDSDEDFSDDGDKQDLEEVGSVDEGSTKSDEEYDDLAMQDVWDQAIHTREDQYNNNLNAYLKSGGEQLSEPLCYYHPSVLWGRMRGDCH